MSHTVGPTTNDYESDLARGLPVILGDGTNTYVYGLDLIAAIDGHYAALHRQWRTGAQPTPDPEAA